MDKKIITVTVNGTRFIMETVLTYDDTSKVPLIQQQPNNSTWQYEAKLRNRQGRK